MDKLSTDIRWIQTDANPPTIDNVMRSSTPSLYLVVRELANIVHQTQHLGRPPESGRAQRVSLTHNETKCHALSAAATARRQLHPTRRWLTGIQSICAYMERPISVSQSSRMFRTQMHYPKWCECISAPNCSRMFDTENVARARTFFVCKRTHFPVATVLYPNVRPPSGWRVEGGVWLVSVAYESALAT